MISRTVPAVIRPLVSSLRIGALALGGALLLALGAQAQSPAASAAGAPMNLRGAEFDGSAFDLARLRGRAVMVFYWGTDCSVCLNKWPELRANAQGWRQKPFTLVSVNVDRTPDAWRDYERLVASTQGRSGGIVRLWAGDPGFSDSLGERPKRLPVTLVIDRQGKIVSRIEGRIAPEAWDEVADLLP